MRVLVALVALAIAPVAGYYGFQRYIAWMLRGQTTPSPGAGRSDTEGPRASAR